MEFAYLYVFLSFFVSLFIYLFIDLSFSPFMYMYGVYVLIHQSTPENPPLYLKNNLVMFYIPTKDTIFVTVFLQDNLLCFPIHARPTQGFHS